MARKKSKIKIQSKKAKELPANHSLKITHLNDKCLIKICSYLESNELANLAASCKRFIPLCRKVFKNRCEEIDSKNPIRMWQLYDRQKLQSFKNLIVFFGIEIKYLRVEYDSTISIDNAQIHELIVEYCRFTLIDIHFLEMSRDLHIKKSFPNLRRAKFTLCHLSASVTQFDNWCENLELLEFEMIESVTKTSCVERSFPKLQRFALMNFIDLNICNKNLRRFIKCNPQLKGFRMSHNVFGISLKITTEFLLYIDRMLPNLESLELIYMDRTGPQRYKEPVPKFSNLKEFQLTCRDAGTLSALMIPNQTIEKLKIDIESGINEYIFNYIMSCQRLQSLTWCLNSIEDLKFVHKFSKNPMPNLTSLRFKVVYGVKQDYFQRSLILNNVIDFMVHGKQLDSIEIDFLMTERYKDMFNGECCNPRCKNNHNCSTSSENVNDDNHADDCEDDDESATEFSELHSQILHSFNKVVEYKFNKAWIVSDYLRKLPHKLIPIINDASVCVAFKKNIKK